MEDRLSTLEQQVQALEQRLAKLEGRSESWGAAPGPRARSAEPEALDDAALVSGSDFSVFLTHAGRSLIVLGGAYLLRALTEGGRLPALTGVALGLAYAVLWLFAAGRAASRGRRGDATFHGLTATAIAYPLLFEATLRFHYLSPPAAAAVLTLLAGLGLGIAGRSRHQVLAWVTTLASLLTALALLAGTGVVLPFEGFLIVLGLATLWLGYEREWTLLRWLAALAADFVALGLVLRALTPARPDAPGAVIGVLLALIGGYLASFAFRTLVRHRDVVPFEFVQSTGILLVGLGGAVLIARSTGSAVEPLGATALVLGAAAYGVAHVFLGRAEGRGVNFHFYGTLALAFGIVGLRLLLADPPLALVFAALALAGAALGARGGCAAFRLHGLVYLVGAAWVSGLLGDAFASTFGEGLARGRASGWLGWLLLPTAAGCVLLLHRRSGAADDALSRLARLGFVGLLVLLLGAAGIDAAMAVSKASLGRLPGLGGLATLRTVVFASAAVGLAGCARRLGLRELGWVAWALLGITGLKILVEDLRLSPPSLLFVAFATCGLAFILVPRLLKAPGPTEG
jgi:hypothetical protein